MQNAALREMGIDGVYVAFDVAPERLEAAVGGRVTVANRTAARAGELAAEINKKVGREAARAVSLEPADLEEALGTAEIMVNTTSLGMSPRLEGMPPVPAAALRPGLFVYDLI